MQSSALHKELLKQINETLDTLFSNVQGNHARVYNAASYTLTLPCKRLRPLITMSAARALDVSEAEALYPACSIELIHCYSLIHDDLPCMDNDDFRRGHPSLHKAFDEATALLAGDLLLTSAFEMLAQAPGIDAMTSNELVQVLARAAGGAGMIGGQMLDLLAPACRVDAAYIQTMHAMKTGQLFAASYMFAGILAGAPSSAIQRLSRLGTTIGIAFQIIDDILDDAGAHTVLGKPLHSDQRNNKITSLFETGAETQKETVQHLLTSARDDIRALFPEEDWILELLKNRMVVPSET